MHITLGALLAYTVIGVIGWALYAMRARRSGEATIHRPAHSLPYFGSLFSIAANFDRFPYECAERSKEERVHMQREGRCIEQQWRPLARGAAAHCDRSLDAHPLMCDRM
jgi:hypothetical protein